jgi:predicted PurR-regulated permease PerM
VINPNLMSGATRWGLTGALILALAVGLYLGQSIFIPLVIALLLAAILWPAAHWLNQGVAIRGFGLKAGFPWVERRGTLTLSISWGTACVTMVLLLVALTCLLPLCLGFAITKMAQDFPRSPDQQQEAYKNFRDRIANLSPALAESGLFPRHADESVVFTTVKEWLDPKQKSFQEAIWNVSQYSISWFWQYILIMFVLFFLLLEGRMLSRRVVGIFGPSPQVQAKAVAALQDMAKQVRTYLVWRTIVNFGLAVILGCFYKWVIGLSQPWTWALLTAILCYIPYFGPIAAGFFPIVDAFITVDPWMAVVVFVFYLLVITLEGYLVVPVVMGRPMRLNATTVLLACLFWYLVWGTPGLFLAMPLLAALKAICIHVPGWQAWANLMSTEDHETKLEEATGPEEDGAYDDTAVLTPEEAKELAAARQWGDRTEVKRTD